MSQLTNTQTHEVVATNMGFMIASNLQDAIKISEIIARSGVCPANYKDKPMDVLVALQMGAEVGLKPMQALQNIAVINGRPSLWGDAMLAVCRQAPDFEYIKEVYDPKTNGYTCYVKRKGEPESHETFTQADAEKAGLWRRAAPSPWATYPKRMLKMRARGFALRDAFPDMLRGIMPREEAEDLYVTREREVSGEVVEEKNIMTPAVEQPTTITVDQLEILKLKIEQSKSDEAALLKHEGVEKLEDIQQSKWANLVLVLDKKISQAAKAQGLKNLAANKNKAEPKEEKPLAVDPETGEVLPDNLQG